jgi:hypothetical protein
MDYEGKGIGLARPNRLSTQNNSLKYRIYPAYKTKKGIVPEAVRWRCTFRDMLIAVGPTFDSVRIALVAELARIEKVENK